MPFFDPLFFDPVHFDTDPIAAMQERIVFRNPEHDAIRVRKLNALAENVSATGSLAISITDLPAAEPLVPLVRWLLTDGAQFMGGTASAGVAATGTPIMQIRQNGVANGSIVFFGAVGVVSFANLTYAPGDLFEIYPPETEDATLDLVSITLTTT